jgi:ATP-binding cassette subfamily C (CFTR/MRP) protein 1
MLTAGKAIWVKMWAEYNERFPNQKLGYYLGIYAMLGGVAFLFLIISCWYVCRLALICG